VDTTLVRPSQVVNGSKRQKGPVDEKYGWRKVDIACGGVEFPGSNCFKGVLLLAFEGFGRSLGSKVPVRLTDFVLLIELIVDMRNA